MSAASEALDGALAAWLARQAVAEERLTSFAFREGQPGIEVPAPWSHVALRGWITATVSDPAVSAFLRLLGADGRPMTELGADGRQMAELVAAGAFGLEPGDRVALAARLGVLAASGLIARDLEEDRVSLTALGRAATGLAEAPEPSR
jgi:hypothetical protein